MLQKHVSELLGIKKQYLSSSSYLTPSKLSLFTKSLDHFVSRYYLHEKDEDSPAMKRGSHIHELVYFYLFSEWSLEEGGAVYNLKDPFILKPDFLEEAPVFKKKSATQPIGVKEQREAYLVQKEKEFMESVESTSQFVIEKKDLRILEALKAHYNTGGFLKHFSERDYMAETLVENEKLGMGGYVDLMSDLYIVDIKTTSMDFSNASDFLKYNIDNYAYQQIIYQDCVNIGEINKEFVFVLIQLVKPYKIVTFQIPDDYLNKLRAKFYHKLLPAYQGLQSEFGWMINDKEEILANKESVNNVYKALVEKGFYNQEIENVVVNQWKNRELTREISMYKDNLTKPRR